MQKFKDAEAQIVKKLGPNSWLCKFNSRCVSCVVYLFIFLQKFRTKKTRGYCCCCWWRQLWWWWWWWGGGGGIKQHPNLKLSLTPHPIFGSPLPISAKNSFGLASGVGFFFSPLFAKPNKHCIENIVLVKKM